MITSRRNLALELDKGKVNIDIISKRLNRVVELWLSRKEIIKEDNFLVLA